jgi:two-component system sensor histidine kinase HydH
MSPVTTLPSGQPSLQDVRRLMESFNQSFERLQQSYKLLEARAEALQRELEEKNRLLDQKTRLELLGQLSATLAHEVRNPLGGLSLYAEQLARELADRPEQRDAARKIIRCADALNGLVSDILTFAGNPDPRPSRQGLDGVVEEALELAADRIARSGVRVERRFGAGGAEADFDRGMIQRALLNLVLNGVDAMEQGGVLTVSTRAIDGGLEAEVADTGPGIAAEILPNLFTPFRTGKARGVGLGLAIARKLIEANGGAIAAANGPRGALFTVRLCRRS